MGAHGSTIRTTVQSGLGKDCEVRTTDEGDAKIQECILDEAFVGRVKAAFEIADLTDVSFRDFVPYIVIALYKPEDAALASLKSVELALVYLADNGEITLPDFAKEMANA